MVQSAVANRIGSRRYTSNSINMKVHRSPGCSPSSVPLVICDIITVWVKTEKLVLVVQKIFDVFEPSKQDVGIEKERD